MVIHTENLLQHKIPHEMTHKLAIHATEVSHAMRLRKMCIFIRSSSTQNQYQYKMPSHYSFIAGTLTVLSTAPMVYKHRKSDLQPLNLLQKIPADHLPDAPDKVLSVIIHNFLFFGPGQLIIPPIVPLCSFQRLSKVSTVLAEYGFA